MPNPRPTFAYLATALRDKHPNMAYLHVTESRVAGNTGIPHSDDEKNDFLHEIWDGGEGREKLDVCGRQRSGWKALIKVFWNPDIPLMLGDGYGVQLHLLTRDSISN
jgi:hypothetical protein